MLSKSQLGAFGKPGSYAHSAAKLRYGARAKILSIPRARGVFSALSEGRIDYGILPLENTTGGWIGDVVSGLIRMTEKDPGCRIVEELNLPVVLALAGKARGREWLLARRVYSHPVPLGHCEDWLSRKLPMAELIECSSTSEAAERASRDQEALAVCNVTGARRYGLRVFVPHIEKETPNLTRFVVLSRMPQAPGRGPLRTSLWFALRDRPGSLRSALEPFDRARVNMTRLESRSLDAFKTYRFYAEVEGEAASPKLRKALSALRSRTAGLAVIGSYPVRVLRPR